MVDSVGQQNLRTIDVSKAVEGYAEVDFVFKKYCRQSSTIGDQIVWYSKTAGEPSAVSPTTFTNISFGSDFANAEVTWSRNTARVKKFGVSGFLPMEDMMNSDVAIYDQTLRDLTRVVVKQVDTRIWDVMSESRSVVNLNSVTTTSVGGDQWDATSGLNPIKDLLRAQRLIASYGYSIDNLVLFVSPTDYESLMVYLTNNGDLAPSVSQAILSAGSITKLLNMDVVVSNNVTADYALVVSKGTTAEWKSLYGTSASIEEKKGVGTTIRVYEAGECLLINPKSACLIIDTQT